MARQKYCRKKLSHFFISMFLLSVIFDTIQIYGKIVDSPFDDFKRSFFFITFDLLFNYVG